MSTINKTLPSRRESDAKSGLSVDFKVGNKLLPEDKQKYGYEPHWAWETIDEPVGKTPYRKANESCE